MGSSAPTEVTLSSCIGTGPLVEARVLLFGGGAVVGPADRAGNGDALAGDGGDDFGTCAGGDGSEAGGGAGGDVSAGGGGGGDCTRAGGDGSASGGDGGGGDCSAGASDAGAGDGDAGASDAGASDAVGAGAGGGDAVGAGATGADVVMLPTAPTRDFRAFIAALVVAIRGFSNGCFSSKAFCCFRNLSCRAEESL